MDNPCYGSKESFLIEYYSLVIFHVTLHDDGNNIQRFEKHVYRIVILANMSSHYHSTKIRSIVTMIESARQMTDMGFKFNHQGLFHIVRYGRSRRRTGDVKLHGLTIFLKEIPLRLI